MTEIKLNVYDLNAEDGRQIITGLNNVTSNIGVGVYHSGVQIGDRCEYFYGYREDPGSGVCRCQPTKAVPEVYKFRETVDIGICEMELREIISLVKQIANSERFQGTSYDLTRNNCNTFSDELCTLLTGNGIPIWVNRGADGLTVVRDGLDATRELANQALASEPVQRAGKAVQNVIESEPVQNVMASVKTGVSQVQESETFQNVCETTHTTAKNIGSYLGSMFSSVSVASTSVNPAPSNAKPAARSREA